MKRVVAISALCALASACSEDAGAPRLAVKYDSSSPSTFFDQVQLFWTHPIGEAGGGYAVEARSMSEPFHVVQYLGVKEEKFSYMFDPSTPEMSDYEFRVRALPGEGEARASNVVRIHRSLRRPVLQCAASCIPVGGGLQLQWTSPSVAADGFILEREVGSFFGTFTILPSVRFPRSATGYVDTDLASWQDGLQMRYVLRATNGSERSAGETLYTDFAPPLAPGSVTATPIPGGIRVSFQQRSRFGYPISFGRAGPCCGGTLPAQIPAPAVGTFTSVDDLLDSPGAYEYSVRVGDSRGRWNEYSAPSKAAAIFMPTAPTGLSFRMERVPRGAVAVRTASGWATAGGLGIPQPFSSVVNHPYLAVAGTLTLSPPTGASLIRPGIVVDAAGSPHAVYTQPAAGSSGSTEIRHAWYDGLAWQTETIATRPFLPRTRVDVGLDGALHASWNSKSVLEVAKRVDGAWQIEDVGAALDPDLHASGGFNDHLLCGDAAGVPHLVVTNGANFSFGTAYHAFHDASGWHSESTNRSFSVLDETYRLVCAAGRVVLSYRTSSSTSGTVGILERTDQGSLPEVILPGFGPATSSDSVSYEIARSADGQLVAIAAQLLFSKLPGKLWLRSDSWTQAATWFPSGKLQSLGFRADGKVWLVSGLSDDPTVTDPVVTLLYEQN